MNTEKHISYVYITENNDILEGDFERLMKRGSGGIMNRESIWDAERWKSDFHTAVNMGDRKRLRSLRIDVFSDTVQDVSAGEYVADSGKRVTFPDPSNMQEGTVLYDEMIPHTTWPEASGIRTIEVIEGDTLEVAGRSIAQGERPLVLNMASRRNPGGGVISGAGAQEEYLFRCSNYFQSLYQFSHYSQEYGIRKKAGDYPLDRDHGGIYSPGVTIYRSNESEGYRKREEPFSVDLVAVPAINGPEVMQDATGRFWMTETMAEGTMHKIRTIFRIALSHGHTALVLGAFGCGAFCNPPNHMARLFRYVLDEKEFREAFSHIMFAIIENHNSYSWFNPHGNLAPFIEELT